VETSALFKMFLMTEESRPDGASMASC